MRTPRPSTRSTAPAGRSCGSSGASIRASAWARARAPHSSTTPSSSPTEPITIFDDGAGPPTVHKYARGIRVALDTKRMRRPCSVPTLTRRRSRPTSRARCSSSRGATCSSAGASSPTSPRTTRAGSRSSTPTSSSRPASYRAYRFPWSAQPVTTPALAQGWGAGDAPALYASWNGATSVAAWRCWPVPRRARSPPSDRPGEAASRPPSPRTPRRPTSRCSRWTPRATGWLVQTR